MGRLKIDKLLVVRVSITKFNSDINIECIFLSALSSEIATAIASLRLR